MNIQRIILISNVALAAAILVVAVFLLLPQSQKFFQLKEELKVVREDLAQKAAYFEGLNASNNKLKDYSKEMQKIETAFTKSTSTPVLLYYFQQTAKENNLDLGQIIFNQNTPSGQSPRLSVSLSSSASLSNFKNFISAIYGDSRLFSIDLIKFNSGSASKKSEGGQDYFNFSLLLSAPDFLKEGSSTN
jgi:Tfp pilus assembly protein PilO